MDERPPPRLLGEVTRQEVESAAPEWVEAQIEATPDPATSLALAAAGEGREVLVLFGTWCGDSRRELARLWRAFDEAGGPPRAAFEYVAVDRSKTGPEALVAGYDLRYVPTLIVFRDGVEQGRIVEESPGGIERDLLDLLTGERSGVISARDDVGAEPPADGGSD